MLDEATLVPELEDSAKAAPLLARVTAKLLIFKSETLKVKVSEVVVTPSVAVMVNSCEVLVS